MDETKIVDGGARFPGVGERIGKWELLRPLEAGGMGVVFLGRRADDVYDQQVAVKLVRPVHLQGDPALARRLVARFEDERAILARVDHPNVARILDGGSTDAGIPYLVMEYVDGVPLTDYCRREKLDVRARVALFAKVCDGVQGAHRHLIVHRDLKPDNILVTADGEPRLLDFGIARILTGGVPAESSETALTAMTPAYASPEQVRQEALSTSSDVYSLGVVLYQLLAGVRPYELGGLRPAEAEHVVCDLNPEPMRKMLERAALGDDDRRQRRAQLAPDLERIVARALHKEPARRYGSAQEFADDLRRWLAGEPVQAHPDSPLYRTRKFVGRHRVGTAAAALALAAVLGAAGIALVQAQRARQAAEDTTRVAAFLGDVLRASDPFEDGAELTLAQAVDLAAANIDARFAGRPDLAADVRQTLGYGMLGRGRTAAAEPLLERALADARAAFGGEDVRTLHVREAIALLRLEQDRVAEAVAGWQAVIASLEAQGLKSDPLYRKAINNLGHAHLRTGDYASAKPLFERARALVAADPSPSARVEHAQVLSNLAHAAHGLGDLDGADRLYVDAETALQSAFPDGHPDTAVVLLNRSQLLAERGDLAGAYDLQQRSLAMREQAFGGDHPMLVDALAGAAQTALRLDRTDEGLALAERADAMAMRLYPTPNRTSVFAAFVHAAALINSARYVDAGEVVTRAEAGLAALPVPPDDLARSVPGVRNALCKRPRNPPVPSCAGIEPTEPALPPG